MLVYYEGSTVIRIEDKLPSAPPIFLRGGRLIFTNKPTTRSNKLNSNFIVFVGLNSDKTSSGNFLGISDFNNE